MKTRALHVILLLSPAVGVLPAMLPRVVGPVIMTDGQYARMVDVAVIGSGDMLWTHARLLSTRGASNMTARHAGGGALAAGSNGGPGGTAAVPSTAPQADAKQTAHAKGARPSAKSIILAAALAVGMVLAFLLTGAGAYNNDQWFILENGRQILEHGFPRTDPFHVWGGSIVIENWLWSVIMFLAWSATGGAVGPAVIVWLTGGCMAFLAWKTSKLVSPSPYAACASALFVICLVAGSLNMVMRPSVASLTLTMLSLLLVMLHAKTGHARYLALVPVVMLAAFNLHMSMAWFVVLVPGVLMLTRVVTTAARSKSAAATMRLTGLYALTVAASIAVTFANPYGLDGVLFLVRSAHIADYRSQIFELMPLVPLFDSGNAYYNATSSVSYACMLILGLAMFMILLARSKTKTTDGGQTSLQDRRRSEDQLAMDAWFAGAGLLAAGMMSSMWIAIRLNVVMAFAAPLLFPVASSAVSRWMEERRRVARKPGRASIWRGIAVGAMALAAIAAPFTVTPLKIPVWHWKQYVDLLDTTQVFEALERAGGRPGDKVWTDGIYGAYLVWNGYKVTHDMRPELIDTALNGEPGHHYFDYVDAQFFDDKAALKRIISDGVDAGCTWFIVDDHKPVGRRLSTDSRFQRVGRVADYGVSVYKYAG